MRILAVRLVIYIFGVLVGIFVISMLAFPPVRNWVFSETGVGTTYGGTWALELDVSGGWSGDGTYGTLTGGVEPLVFQMPDKEGGSVETDYVEWDSDLVGAAGPLTSTVTMKGKQKIEGKIENGKFVFLPHYSMSYCHGVATAPGIVSSGDCTSTGEIPGDQWTTIEIKDNAQVNQGYPIPGGRWDIVWTLRAACKENLPDIKSQVDSLLEESKNLTPEKIHTKLFDLTLETFRGRTYKDNGKCLKVKGFSVDLQYKIGETDDSIFKKAGSVDGPIHKIIAETMEDQINRDGQKVDVYYSITIDVSLEEI